MSCHNILQVKEKEKLTKDNGRYCALKIIDKKKFWQRVSESKERADSIIREVTQKLTQNKLFYSENCHNLTQKLTQIYIILPQNCHSLTRKFPSGSCTDSCVFTYKETRKRRNREKRQILPGRSNFQSGGNDGFFNYRNGIMRVDGFVR
jgi:hypothetical protein